MDGWDWLWGAWMMVLFSGVLVAVIVFAVRASNRGSRPNSGETKDARTVLETRFARGEISQQEFEQRSKVLGSRP